MELTFDQKIEILKDPNCSPKLLQKMADDGEYFARRIANEKLNVKTHLIDK